MARMDRIVFFGTPDFAVPALKALIDHGMAPVGVVTQPPEPVGRKQILTPSPVAVLARNASIQVSEPRKLKGEEFLTWFKALKPDVAVLAAYGKILPAAVLEVPRLGFINIHPSLLPRHRGASPIAGAILSGDKTTGVTIIKLDEQVDHGPIIMQENIPIPEKASTQDLTPLLAQLGANLLLKALPNYLDNPKELTEQKHVDATFTKILARDDGSIDWNKSAVDIDRQVRAFTPWPSSFTCWKSHRLKILETQLVARELLSSLQFVAAAPGSVFVQHKTIFVNTGSQPIQINRLQMAGSKPQTAKEFLNGHGDFSTAVLGPC